MSFVSDVHSDQQRRDLFHNARIFQWPAVHRAHPRNLRQSFHQALRAAAGPDAAHGDGFVGGVTAGSGEIPTERRVAPNL